MKNYLNAAFIFALIDLHKDLEEQGIEPTLEEAIQMVEAMQEREANKTGL